MPDRKYRQQGYQDGARRSGGDFTPAGGPGRVEGGPRGRGAERNRAEVFRCKSCGERADPAFAQDAVCRKCGSPLHACRQCRSFDSTSPFQCSKPIPAAIPAKSARNDCGLFEPALVADLTGSKASDTPDQARTAFDKLFGK